MATKKTSKFGSKRTKRYDEGGDVEEMKKGIASGFKAEAPEGPNTGLSREKFGDAFKRNRARGEKTFEFQGKKYTTEMKGEKPNVKKSIPSGPNESNAETSRLTRAAANRPAKEPGLEGSHPEAMLIGGPLAKLAGRAIMGGEAVKEVTDRVEPTMTSTPRMDARATAEELKRAPRSIEEESMAGEGGPNFKRGGKVKKMASGGSTRTASSRADGCALRGKTRA
jgi:hypothetical protein